MARLQVAKWTEEDETQFFNLSHTVGKNASNYWTDIQVVQYFIMTIYMQASGAGVWRTPIGASDRSDLPFPSRDYKDLKKTERWIRKFQSDAISGNGDNLVVDGLVAPAPQLKSRLTGRLYCITMLNEYFRITLGELGILDPYSFALADDPLFPPLAKGELIASFSGNVVIGGR